MKALRKTICSAASVAALLVAISGPLSAQEGLDPAIQAHPPADSWPGYHGDYSGRRHSSLKQITPQNVQEMGLAWLFQTGQSNTIKSPHYW